MNKQTEDALCIAIETPLKDLLKRVPKDGFDMYEHSSISHQNIPYGRLIHMALIEIERLEAALESQDSEQKPVYFIADDSARGWVMVSKNEFNQANDDDRLKLYTRPTKRLSDDEIWTEFFKTMSTDGGYTGHKFARAIEQAHGIGVKE